MDFRKWEAVVVEWANCLKLSTPINRLEDLKNGLFLSSLISLLTGDEHCHIKEPLLIVINFLKERYPNFIFSYAEDFHFQDISEIDIVVISSLLLHYSCIFDRRDVLTSPLCHQLSKNTQTYIKAFLENVKKDLTEPQLFQIIKECVSKEFKQKSLRTYQLQSGDSHLTYKSPLQALLHTPPSKTSRFHEKDREINKLLQEIDSERFEKADLQGELVIQKERNNKLNNEVVQKSTEISKLRSEIADLESKPYELNQTDESRELQQRLRAEIDSLEKYVKLLQTEQDQLYTDCDFMKDKLKKVESECLIWQDKALSTESNYDKVTEKCQQQEIELKNLQSHCKELSALLEEFRATRRNESTVEVDCSVNETHFRTFETNSFCEDLARDVVEVQLQDAQKENNELKSLLEESREHAIKLDLQLSGVKATVLELQNNYEFIKADNTELLQKVSVLTDTQDALALTREDLQKASQEVAKLLKQNHQIGILRDEVLEKNLKITHIEYINKSLIEDLNVAEKRYNQLELSLATKSEFCCGLEEKIAITQLEYEKLLETYNCTDFNLQSITNNFNQLDTNMQESLQKLEKLVFGNNTIELTDKNSAFNKIYLQIEENNLQSDCEKQKVQSNLTTLEELIAKLKLDLECLNEKESINLQERHALSKNLKCGQQQIATLQSTISEHVNKIQTLNSTICEMSCTIMDLEVLKEVVEEKENEIVDLQTTNSSLEMRLTKSNEELIQSRALQGDLQKSLENLERIKNDFEMKIEYTQNILSERKDNEEKLGKTIDELRALRKIFEKEMAETKEELIKCKEDEEGLKKTLESLEGLNLSLENQLFEANNKISEQKSTESLLKKDIFEQEKQYQESVKVLNAEIDGYNKKIHELELNLQSCNLNYHSVQDDLAIIVTSKKNLEEEVELCKANFDERLTVLNVTISTLEQDLQQVLQEKKDLQEDFNNKCNECKNLESERDQDVLQYVTLEEQLNEVLEKLKVVESQTANQDDLLTKANQDLLMLKLDVEAKNEQIKFLENDILGRDKEIQRTANQIVGMDFTNNELRCQYKEIQTKLLILENLKETLEDKCTDLESKAQKIASDLSEKNIRLEDITKQYRLYKHKTETEILNLTSALDQSTLSLEKLSEEKCSLVIENKREIDNLKDEIVYLTEQNESLNNREKEHVEEIRVLRTELSDTMTKYSETLQMCREIENENEMQVDTLTQDLHEVIEKYNNIDKIHAETISELNKAQERLTILENNKAELETKLQEQKLDYEIQHNSCFDKLHLEIETMAQKEAQLKSELLEVSEKLKASETDNNYLNYNFGLICSELTKIKVEKSELRGKVGEFHNSCQDLKHLYGSLKSSQLQITEEHYHNLNKLRVELSEQIACLVEENCRLQDTVRDLQENTSLLRTEQDIINALHIEKIEQKDDLINILEDDNRVCKEHIENLIEEKKVIQEQIAAEKENLLVLQRGYEGKHNEDSIKFEECQNSIIKLKCASDILETGKVILEQEICNLKSNIDELEECKVKDKMQFYLEIEKRENDINNWKNTSDILQIQVAENVRKNNELMLELCTVNESLQSLTLQYQNLKQMSKAEKEGSAEKLLCIEMESQNKQQILEDMQLENTKLSEEIKNAKEEIEELKTKLKTNLSERQILEQEISTTQEKLSEQTCVIQQHEATISEVNDKLLKKVEEMLAIEREKYNLQMKLNELCKELDKVSRSRDEILESQAKIFKETENNLIRAHENAIVVKNDLLKRVEVEENEKINERQLRDDVEKLLDGEKIAKEILEIRVLELTNEKSKLAQVLSVLKHNIQSLEYALAEKPIEAITDGEKRELRIEDVEYLNSNLEVIKGRIFEVLEQNSDCGKQISMLETEKGEITKKISDVSMEKDSICEEKEKLIRDYNELYNEKISRERDLESMKNIEMEHLILTAKYDQLKAYNRNNDDLKSKCLEQQEQIVQLETMTAKAFNTYKTYAGYSITYKAAIEKLITERGVLENTLGLIKQNLFSVNKKMLQILDEREHSRLTEQVEPFDIVAQDVQKQFARVSSKIHQIILTIVQVPADIYDVVNIGMSSGAENIFDKVDFDEELEKVVDCRDRATDLLGQIITFETTLNSKTSNTNKENVSVLRSSNNLKLGIKVKDEELQKKNTLLKQRLTLAENAKSNLEKKIKQLRQENKVLNCRSEVTAPVDHDVNYKILLQQHIQAKEEYEKTLAESKELYNKLLHEHEEYKAKAQFIPDQIQCSKETRTEQDLNLEGEVIKLRDAYANVMSNNSKLELENVTLRKLLEECTKELSKLKVVQEAYEKLLEENNKLRMECDTIKYKRNRDREALLEVMQKDQDENKKIQDVRNEYEGKLEKMKNKMVQVYRDEMDKEGLKQKRDQSEKVHLLKTIEQLKYNLQELTVKKGNQNCEFCQSQPLLNNNQMCGNGISAILKPETFPDRDSIDVNNRNSITRRKDDRKYSTLPRSTGMGVIDEDEVFKRNTIHSVPENLGENLEMEDEEDGFFNNKYLGDLKEGRCVLPSGRESNVNRLSELKWRNSMCPPHLKSSYPAETQFASPTRFKENDLKLGLSDFNDSLSTKLLPGEKPRKKDMGTTSYKKPGPPTPSKNGGRVSLQGNEVQPREVLREQNESKTPKRITPNRLKALFMGRNSSVRDENQPGTPRSKRLSIFRKPK